MTRSRRQPTVAGEGYAKTMLRGFIAACFLYVYVQLIYSVALVAGTYQGLVIAGGTGSLLGLFSEWLRRRRI